MKRILFYGLVSLVVISSPFLYRLLNKSTSITPPVKVKYETVVIDKNLSINEELQDVNFCGTSLKVKQIKLDGVDIVQKIAELIVSDKIPTKLQSSSGGQEFTVTKEDMEKQICRNIIGNNPSGIVLVNKITKLPSTETSLNEGEIYYLNIAQEFLISASTGNIYIESKFDGALTGPIGKLN